MALPVLGISGAWNPITCGLRTAFVRVAHGAVCVAPPPLLLLSGKPSPLRTHCTVIVCPSSVHEEPESFVVPVLGRSLMVDVYRPVSVGWMIPGGLSSSFCDQGALIWYLQCLPLLVNSRCLVRSYR
uniref:Uncharacterized protein n=1 Tax=Rousettus aegyptiacus TaxID=9407 RepID=A0A7J8HRR0_ROUAE|nr:hypothetical protein HJG63_011091 [Rousettus aegyptiacus]